MPSLGGARSSMASDSEPGVWLRPRSAANLQGLASSDDTARYMKTLPSTVIRRSSDIEYGKTCCRRVEMPAGAESSKITSKNGNSCRPIPAASGRVVRSTSSTQATALNGSDAENSASVALTWPSTV